MDWMKTTSRDIGSSQGRGLAVAGALIASLLISSPSDAARLKDLASVEGVRSHPLVGYGLVVGLQGSGDDNGVPFTKQSIASLLKRMGVVIPRGSLRVRNGAAVMVTSKLPAFARVGQKVDVQVASIGSAKSLAGGLLLLTPLKGPDGRIYASAQGQMTVGGFRFGKNGTSVQKNHTAAGTVPNGGTIERALVGTVGANAELHFILAQPDFTTAFRIAQGIDEALGGKHAAARDASSVVVKVPEVFTGRMVELLATLESVEVEPDGKSKVVINERTGTVVLGRDVRIAPVAVAHGNLTVEISTEVGVSQPNAFSQGQTVAAEQSDVEVNEEDSTMKMIPDGGSLEDVVAALNALGATPRDLISILQAIKAAGALDAELEVR